MPDRWLHQNRSGEGPALSQPCDAGDGRTHANPVGQEAFIHRKHLSHRQRWEPFATTYTFEAALTCVNYHFGDLPPVTHTHSFPPTFRPPIFDRASRILHHLFCPSFFGSAIPSFVKQSVLDTHVAPPFLLRFSLCSRPICIEFQSANRTAYLHVCYCV